MCCVDAKGRRCLEMCSLMVFIFNSVMRRCAAGCLHRILWHLSCCCVTHAFLSTQFSPGSTYCAADQFLTSIVICQSVAAAPAILIDSMIRQEVRL